MKYWMYILNLKMLTLCFISFQSVAQNDSPEDKLAKMGIELKAPGTPIANYLPAVRIGNLIFLSGAGPQLEDGSYITGRVGENRTVEEAYGAARLVAIRHLSILKNELGDLDKIKGFVKVLGMVNCTAEFDKQPAVINGYSDLIAEVLGQRGKHARSAVGMHALPLGMLLEIEAIVEIRD